MNLYFSNVELRTFQLRPNLEGAAQVKSLLPKELNTMRWVQNGIKLCGTIWKVRKNTGFLLVSKRCYS